MSSVRMLNYAPARLVRGLRRRLFAPSLSVSSGSPLVRLGSAYGGWTFEPRSELYGSTVISCGLGEDASFDVEFAAMFDARVIAVDPTPRAVAHHAEITKAMGLSRTQCYSKSGKQPVRAYELGQLTPDQLLLEQSALWYAAETVKFFAPLDPDHVSYSIVNIQRHYAQDTPHLVVPATTVSRLMKKYALSTLPLLKLDIEGAEISVIPELIRASVKPEQILVEFDEMNFPSSRSRRNVEDVDASLRNAGYVCRFCDGKSNYLYVLQAQDAK